MGMGMCFDELLLKKGIFKNHLWVNYYSDPWNCKDIEF